MNILLVLAATTVSAIHLVTAARDSGNTKCDFKEYVKTYNKAYGSKMEEEKRQKIFMENCKKVNEHNERGSSSFKLGMNKFGDMSSTEFSNVMNGLLQRNLSSTPAGGKPRLAFAISSLPGAFDWRDEGCVTPVKDQGQCGSCWSFSATGALEGQNCVKYGSSSMKSLSEQNLIDCSRGWMDYAFEYVKQNNGIDTEVSYPYEETMGLCRYNPNNRGSTCTSYTDVPSGDENALQQAVATKGPISVAIDASWPSFQLYQTGVYYEPQCSSTQLDHGVLAVGYGTTADGIPYWIVKNSWGTNWGQNGYILMARNKNNNCGIATAASYPSVA